LPLTIIVFGHLHKQFDKFLQVCATNMWGMKGLKGQPFFYNKFVPTTYGGWKVYKVHPVWFQQPSLNNEFQLHYKRHKSFPSYNYVALMGLATSHLPPLIDPPPIPMSNLLVAIGIQIIMFHFMFILVKIVIFY